MKPKPPMMTKLAYGIHIAINDMRTRAALEQSPAEPTVTPAPQPPPVD